MTKSFSDCLVYLPPESLLGWRSGRPVDLKPYEDIGFRHPRPAWRYDFESKAPDPELMTILDGIARSGSIADPLLVYRHESLPENSYLVLDGMTRLTAVARMRLHDASCLRRLPCVVFEGTMHEALIAMVARNLRESKRRLSWSEEIGAYSRLLADGWETEEVVKALGPPRKGLELNEHLAIMECATRELVAAIDDGRIEPKVAFSVCRWPDKKQLAFIKEAEQALSAAAAGPQKARTKRQARSVQIVTRQAKLAECAKVAKSIHKQLQGIERFMSGRGLMTDGLRKALGEAAPVLGSINKMLDEAAGTADRVLPGGAGV